MTNRLSKWSRRASQLVCLLAACGLMYACKDEFTSACLSSLHTLAHHGTVACHDAVLSS